MALTKKSKERLDQFVKEIDEYTEPKNMSKQSALEFLELMTTDLEGRIDGLKDELKGGEEG